MSSKTQLNEYIKVLRRTCGEQEQQIERLNKDLKWANDQVGGLTLKLEQYRNRSWWKKLINIY